MCAVRNDLLGGSDYIDGETIEAVDANDTNNDLQIKGLALIPVAQIPYKLLSAGTFTNVDLLGAEVINARVGKNSTISASSTAYYGTFGTTHDGQYSNLIVNGADTTVNGTFTNPTYAFDLDDTTSATASGGTGTSGDNYIGKTFSSRYIGKILISATSSATSGASHNSSAIYLQTYNGSTWSDVATLDSKTGYTAASSYAALYTLNATTQGIRIRCTASCTTSPSSWSSAVTTLNYYVGTATVISDTGITLDGTEKALALYTSKTFYGTGSMTVSVSDGTNTIADKDYTKVIDISTLSSGSLRLTFNLGGTDTSNYASFAGYGVALIK